MIMIIMIIMIMIMIIISINININIIITIIIEAVQKEIRASQLKKTFLPKWGDKATPWRDS